MTPIRLQRSRGWFSRVAAVFVGGVVTVGCGATIPTAECASVCNRYGDCFDGSFNVQGCIAQCRTSAAADKGFVTTLQRCDVCISEEACVQAAFPCAAVCTGVIAVTAAGPAP